MFFSCHGDYLIGLFYEVTSNVNPYAVKVWSTNDLTLRPNPHPIKCSISLPSKQSSMLYMAGKQKYGRGISLGLLDFDTCSLIRELKSDPETSIGDEIRRIIQTDNENYVLVACTEHGSSFTCFVIFKLGDNQTDPLSTNSKTSLSNCTMILTRFDCDPHHTFPLKTAENATDERMLTVLRNNQILIWQLIDGEIRSSYDFHHLNSENQIQTIVQCQVYENRLFVLLEQGTLHLWNVQSSVDESTLIATISDPLVSYFSIELDQTFPTGRCSSRHDENDTYSFRGEQIQLTR